jgi:uncharacterized membrane protein
MKNETTLAKTIFIINGFLFILLSLYHLFNLLSPVFVCVIFLLMGLTFIYVGAKQ